jgi:hypothetical protein
MRAFGSSPELEDHPVIAVPHVPRLQVAFWLTIGGIAIITMSRKLRLKRVVAPLTFVLFSYVWLEGFRLAFDPPAFVLALFCIPLTVNGLRVLGKIRYCARCGHTLEEGRRRRLCKECAALPAEERAVR